jgi:hypothetical protein
MVTARANENTSTFRFRQRSISRAGRQRSRISNAAARLKSEMIS